MRQNALGGRAPPGPGPAGGASALPDRLAAIGGKGRGGEGRLASHAILGPVKLHGLGDTYLAPKIICVCVCDLDLGLMSARSVT